VRSASSEKPARREGREPEAGRRVADDVEEPRAAEERDLLDSSNDSWRYLRYFDMLDEIGAAPHERSDS
jgi:hypothetical protein